MENDHLTVTLITHTISALLGGGLAALVNAITGSRTITLKQYAALNQALQETCRSLRAENREYEQAIWQLRQGVLALHKQVRELGGTPCYEPNGDLPEGENHNGHE